MTLVCDVAAISAMNGGYGAISWMTGHGRLCEITNGSFVAAKLSKAQHA
jgi:hypothetical protein